MKKLRKFLMMLVLVFASTGCDSYKYLSAQSDAENEIKKRLKDPDSAKLTYIQLWHYQSKENKKDLQEYIDKGARISVKNDLWMVAEKVKAKNSFGAFDTSYYCVGRQSDKTVFLKKCTGRLDNDDQAFLCCHAGLLSK